MRAFISIELDEEVKKEIQKFVNNLEGLGEIRLVDPKIYHICLKFLGEISEEQAKKVKKYLEELDVKRFKIKFKGIGCFPNENFIRVVWVGTESKELDELGEKIQEELEKFGFMKNEFKAHITVGRVKSIKDKEKFREKIKGWKEHDFGEMNVDKIVIKKSVLTREGPEYSDYFIKFV